ncbi:hypothetical protein BOTBODRAFT_50989 [Botryobasidium botryosum FD-172 SS1]|uniref:Uncharacterized protein n=1 Tax=Botryobasidium botryosum (strain FD-172 SS1) TaxID=930990 RepID=A0A067NB18_BOTB1|nr:hypothetical protein BOTBODRAFT_50989 [Botryobasidium botryosum FD-172 SS1]
MIPLLHTPPIHHSAILRAPFQACFRFDITRASISLPQSGWAWASLLFPSGYQVLGTLGFGLWALANPSSNIRRQ